MGFSGSVNGTTKNAAEVVFGFWFFANVNGKYAYATSIEMPECDKDSGLSMPV